MKKFIVFEGLDGSGKTTQVKLYFSANEIRIKFNPANHQHLPDAF